MVSEHEELAAYFDRWYADMAAVSSKDEIQQRHLGLPPDLLSTSLLSWDGIAEVAARLALTPGDLLVDLACGRGGYGLELAARSGADLVGIDFAPAALEAARALAARRGQAAEFRLGDMVATGLPDAAAAGVVVVDAIQFPNDAAAAYREILRILRPGGRAVLTAWEARGPHAPELPERLRRTDVRGGLVSAGFVSVVVEEHPEWLAAERAMWGEAAALDPGDDPALRAFHEEGRRVLPTLDQARRVVATAARPVQD